MSVCEQQPDDRFLFGRVLFGTAYGPLVDLHHVRELEKNRGIGEYKPCKCLVTDCNAAQQYNPKSSSAA